MKIWKSKSQNLQMKQEQYTNVDHQNWHIYSYVASEYGRMEEWLDSSDVPKSKTALLWNTRTVLWRHKRATDELLITLPTHTTQYTEQL